MSYSDVKKRFGLAIKTWRRNSGISQEELAWRAGLHRSYVADIERGVRNASLQSIEKLAKALDVSFSTLFEPLGNFPGSKTTPQKDEVLDILLVESHPRDVELTIQAFRKSCIENPIHVARDSSEALEYLFGSSETESQPLRTRPQLILLSLSLPNVGALDVLRRIRRDPRARQIPVVVLGAAKSPQETLESKRLGAEIHISKPMDIQRFCAVIPKLSCYWALFMRSEQESNGGNEAQGLPMA